MKRVSLILISAICVSLVNGCSKEAQDKSSPVSQTSTSPSFTPTPQAEGKDMETVLVTVEGASLTRAMAMNMARAMAARQGVAPQMMEQFMNQMGSRFEQQAIDQFINQTLIAQEAARRDIPVSDEEIDAVIAKLSGDLPQGTTLDQALQAQNMQESDLRDSIIANERMRKLYETETTGAAEATDKQVTVFYDENTQQFAHEEEVAASHILIGCDKDADAEAHAAARSEAEDLRKQLAEGADFAELAKAHSSCPSKEQGGSLGSFSRGRMAPEFEEAAFSQEVGTVSEVVKTPFGYHLINVTDRTAASTSALDEVSGEIRTHLNRQAKEALFGTFLEGLREKAEITYPKTDA